MLRFKFAILFLFSSAAMAQQLPCDHSERQPLEIKVPNVFSPNGDGTNDLFRSQFNENRFTNYSMYIYNRAGQLIFYADRPAQGWDGRTPSGAKCPEGTYFYVLDYHTDCENDRFSGVLELVR